MRLTDEQHAGPLPGPSVSPGPLRPRPDFGPTDTARGWYVTIVLTVIAALTRFAELGYPTDAGTPVFDEKHYVPQAWQLLTNGMGIEDNPAYGLVVHPPVGKLLIALGEAIFGYTSWGWRFSSACAGTLMVLLVIRIVRRMTRSTLVGAIAGIVVIADGVSFVASRTGLLDIFLALFATAAFGCLIVDRDDVRARMARADAAGRTGDTPYGPRLGVRWWRFGAGVLLGLTCGTKWSGAEIAIAFMAMSLCFDYLARRSYGVARPWAGVALRDLGPTLYSMVVIPIGVYLASYAGWFASETGVDRHEVGVKVGTGGFWSFLPDALRSLWYYSDEVLKFHTSLTNSAGFHHPWESKPWTWPMSLRPMLYYIAEGPQVSGCGQSSCVKAVMMIGTPAIWWLAFPVLGWALYRTMTRRDWRYAAALVGYGATWLPWFSELDRQMYFYYATAMAPFYAMLVALVLGDVLAADRHTVEGRSADRLVVSLYLGVVVANFIWLYPILSAMPITQGTWNNELWLPSWR
jgi:dolichyl-phosphate-mannose--protein O-mannosyl transferase